MKQQTFYNNNKAVIAAKVLLILLFAVSYVSSQTAKTAIVRVNKFWGTVNDFAINTSSSYSANDLNLFADQGAIGARLMGDECMFGGFIALASTNWRDTTGGIVTMRPKAFFPPQSNRNPNGLPVVTAMTNYVRYASPADSVFYQGTGSKLPSPNFGASPVVNPANCVGTSDQTITVTNKFYNNVLMTRRILAWGQQKHDNYVVTDLTFDNPATNDTLKGFYIFLHEGDYYNVTADGSVNTIAAVDNFVNTALGYRRWYHYYGDRPTDSLRIFYEYMADDPERVGSNMGQPLTEQQGRLFRKDYFFAATLHASQAPFVPAGTAFPAKDANDVNDDNQPRVTTYANMQSVLALTLWGPAYTPASDPGYYDLASGLTTASDDLPGSRPGHHRKSQDELGKAAPGGEAAMDPTSTTWGNMCYSYGPYTFAPGTRIRIVKISGFAGISRELAMEVGRKWMNNTLTEAPGLPNATTGYFPSNFVFPVDATAKDKIKDRWISVGIKELHETVSRAKWNFLSGYNAPVTTAPPLRSAVKPVVGGIKISWLSSADKSKPGFVGYRLFKKMSTYDTVLYKIVYQGTDTSFFDTQVRPSPKYFYYTQAGVVAGTDTIWSSRFWKYNSIGTSSNTAPSVDGLDQIVIAPNPFNYNDPMLARYSFQNPKNLTVTFFKLPKDVTIKLYTEYGDLVKSVSNSGTGEYKMKMVNDKGQAIASGVYIVVYETPDGGFSYQKFVVAR
ncbi:MAG: hypothetical protein EHM64_09415 [Ignavibacteriae bacterium]|nr:MAG: hypothetical protein EHM64_09415 [Ignavibacteriota bacterium]